jgi:hypothetical protein
MKNFSNKKASRTWRATLIINIKSFLVRHHAVLLASVFFFLLASFLTWPFVVHPFSTQVGSNYGDIFGSIAKFDAIKNDGNNPFIDGRINSIAYPDGVRSNVGVDRVSFLSTLFLWVLTLLYTSTFAHNMYVFLGYFITALVMFLFIRKYTKSNRLGLIAGSAFITFPLFISLARAAPVYMWSWLYILPIWAIIELTKSYSTKKLILAGLSIIPGVFWTPYFMFHVFLVTLTCVAVYAIMTFRKQHTLPYKHLAFLAGAIIVVAGAYVAIGHSSSSSTVIPDRPISDAYDQSLDPRMLVTPTMFTAITAPIYENFIKPISPRDGTAVLFAGYTVCVLAFVGAYAVMRNRYLTKDMRLLGVFGGAITIVTLAFSLAPTITILDIRIPTLNYFVVHAVPALRAGQRLVVPIMLGLIILATLGVYYLSRRVHMYVRPSILLACIAILIAVEYVTVFDQMSATMRVPPSMKVLAKAPKGVTAEYLNDSLIGYPGQLACKNYLIHHQTIVNPCSLDVYTKPGKWPIVEAIAKQSTKDQLEQLKHIGVTYVIVDGTSVTMERLLRQENKHLFASDSKFRIYTIN